VDDLQQLQNVQQGPRNRFKQIFFKPFQNQFDNILPILSIFSLFSNFILLRAYVMLALEVGISLNRPHWCCLHKFQVLRNSNEINF